MKGIGMIEAWKQWEGHTVDDRFPLLQCLAGSEHAAVFLTEYGEPEPRNAAIKFGQTDPETVEQQLARWHSAAKLCHPHLLRLYESGTCHSEDATLLYVVTEYADEDLSQVLPYRPLTTAEVDQTFKPVLDALSYLHGNGHAHGHLKPANIMATGDEVRLSIDGVRNIGEAVGLKTPSIYDAPELPETGASPEADVWAVGVILLECFTQKPPSWESLEYNDPLRLGTLPEPFSEIAVNCLRPDARQRWTLSDIESHLDQTSTSPQQAAPPRHRTKGSVPRYVRIAAALGLALLALLGFSLIDQTPVADPTSSPLVPPPNQPDAEPQPPSAGASLEPGPEQPSAARQINPLTTPNSTPVPAVPEATTPTGDLLPGEVVRQVLPDVPTKASNTIDGRVRVRVKVRVNASGQVEDAELDFPGPSRYFANLALQAARRWEFTPAMLGGQPAPSQWLIRFVFTRSGIEVRPQALTALSASSR